MNIIELSTLKKLEQTNKKQKVILQKSHADLLKEAFIALEKYNVPQMYKTL